MKTNDTNFSNFTLIDAIAAQSVGASVAISKIIRIAPPPADKAGLFFVCKGALKAFEAALISINFPAAAAFAIRAEFAALSDAAYDVFGDREMEDLKHRTGRRLADYPAWAALMEVGKSDTAQPTSAAMAIGINLAMAYTNDAPMAAKYSWIWRAQVRRPLLSTDELLTLNRSGFPGGQLV